MKDKQLSEYVISEIKDVILKVQNATTNLKSGKEVITYNKLTGINQKLNHILKNVNDYNEKASEESSSEKEEEVNA